MPRARHLASNGLQVLLTKLEKQGLVTTSWEEVKTEGADPDASGCKRKWYTLSPKGRKQLDKHIEAHKQMQSLLDNFLSGTEVSA